MTTVADKMMERTTDLGTRHYGTPKYAGQRMTKADFLRWKSVTIATDGDRLSAAPALPDWQITEEELFRW